MFGSGQKIGFLIITSERPVTGARGKFLMTPKEEAFAVAPGALLPGMSELRPAHGVDLLRQTGTLDSVPLVSRLPTEIATIANDTILLHASGSYTCRN